jgi:hypothetical protein
MGYYPTCHVHSIPAQAEPGAPFSLRRLNQPLAPMGPMRTVVLPFTKVPCQSRKKKADAGGITVTAQAGRMQQHTAQGSPGKMSGVHGRWDLRASPIRSAREYTVFIMRDSFSSCILRIVTGGKLRSGLSVGYGVFTLYRSTHLGRKQRPE